jgi:hypothetical protein
MRSLVSAVLKEADEGMDAWQSVVGHPDVCYILRELYGSTAICVANRTAAPLQIIADCSGSHNATLLCAEALRLPSAALALRHVVAAGQTIVIGVLSPLSAAIAVEPDVTLSLVPMPVDTDSFAASTEAAAVIDAAEAKTTEIDGWLSQRRVEH